MDTKKEIRVILKRLEALEEKVKTLESVSGETRKKPRKRISVQEYLLEKGPQSNPQKTLVIGHFYEKYEGKGSFNVEDLKMGYKAAKETCPGNISDTVYKNIQKGNFMEEEKGEDGLMRYVLTNTGETTVDTGFNNT